MKTTRSEAIERLLRKFIATAVTCAIAGAAACSASYCSTPGVHVARPVAEAGALPPLASLGEKPSTSKPLPSLPDWPLSGISNLKFSPNGKILAVAKVTHTGFRLLLLSLQGRIIKDLGTIPRDNFEWGFDGRTIYYRAPLQSGPRGARAKECGLDAVALTGKRFSMSSPKDTAYFLTPMPGGGISFMAEGTVKNSRTAKNAAHEQGSPGAAIWAWVAGHPARELTPVAHIDPPFAISSRGGIAVVETARDFPVGELHQFQRGKDRIVVPISKARFMGGYGKRWRGTTGLYCVWVVWVPGPTTQFTPAEFGNPVLTGELGWIDVATGKLHPLTTVERIYKAAALPPGADGEGIHPEMVSWSTYGGALITISNGRSESLVAMTPRGALTRIAEGGRIRADWAPSGRQAAIDVDGSLERWDQASGKVRRITIDEH